MSGSYNLLKTNYGFYVKFEDKICYHDLQDWFNEFKPMINLLNVEFNAIIDLRNVKPICTDTARALTYARSYLHGKGLLRVAIVYSTSATIMELMKSFSELGINENERHICSSMNSNWKEVAENWVKKGIEP